MNRKSEISSQAKGQKKAAPISQDSNPGATGQPLDISALIDARPIGWFQGSLMVMIGAVVMMDGFDLQALGFVAPTLIREWGLEPSQLGPIFSAALIGMLLGSITLSWAADRLGRRPVLVASTALFGLAVLASAAARSPEQLIVFRFFTGLGVGGVLGNAVALASEYSPHRRRASILMWISCGFTGGALLGGLVSAVLIPSAGWRAVFLLGGCVTLGAATLMAAFLPESLQFMLLRGSDQAKARKLLRLLAPDLALGPDVQLAVPEAPTAKPSPAQLFGSNRASRTLLLWGISFANLLALFFLTSWLPTLFARGGASHSQAVLAGTILQVGGITGAIVMGPLIDRRGFYPILAIAFALGAFAIGAIGLPASTQGLQMLAVLLSGICIIGAQPGINALAAALYPTELRATGVGWTLGVGRVGSILGPLLTARFLALNWSNATLYWTAAIPAALAVVLTLSLWRVSGGSKGAVRPKAA